MSGSVSFDQAAAYYDDTRSLPETLMQQLVPMLMAELPRDGRCLEIGVGTGRIALPLLDGGIDVVGVDISLEMLRRYVAKAGSRSITVAIADATHLPFADGTFSCAIASHVLHLIPGWKSALDELLRVVRPGGVLLASRSAENARTAWQDRVRRRFFIEAGDPPWPPGLSHMHELDREMRSRKATVRELQDVANQSTVSIADLLDLLERGVYAACWSIDAETRRRAAAATRQWASRELGDLDQKRPTRSSSDWRAYSLPE